MTLNRIPIKKGRVHLLVVLLVAIVALMVLLSKCSTHTRPEQKLQIQRQASGGDTLDVAIEISPLSFKVSGDTIAGLDYELLRAVESLSGRPLKFHPFAPMDYAIEGLDSGYYDIVVSFLPSTESLKKNFALSDPVYLDREVLVQLNDSLRFISSPDQLGNDTVWIADGSPFRQRIENLSSEIGEHIEVATLAGHTAEHLIMLVATGKIPRAVVNEGIATRMKEEHYPNLNISTPVSFTQLQCWIVSQNDSGTGDFVNYWLDSLKRTDIYPSILAKYGLSKNKVIK